MKKFLVGLVIAILLGFVWLQGVNSLQQQQTTQIVAQTAQTQAQAFAWREYNQTLQTLYAIMSLLCGGIVVFIVLGIGGFVSYRLNKRKQQGQQGKWLSGSNTYWGRAGMQSSRPIMRPQDAQRFAFQGYPDGQLTYPPQPVMALPDPQYRQSGYSQPFVSYNPYFPEYSTDGLIDGLFFDEE